MRKAIDIANYLLELFKFDEDGLTNLKLNKLLYYVQGCSYQRFNRPLFEDEIEAWNYGPVIPNVYKTFKPCGSNRIQPPGISVDLDDDEINLLLDVAREYGQYSGSGLVTMTHRNGSPWHQVYKDGERNTIIPKNLIKTYFQNNEKKLPLMHTDFSENDFIGYRDEEGYLVLPKEYDE